MESLLPKEHLAKAHVSCLFPVQRVPQGNAPSLKLCAYLSASLTAPTACTVRASILLTYDLSHLFPKGDVSVCGIGKLIFLRGRGKWKRGGRRLVYH